MNHPHLLCMISGPVLCRSDSVTEKEIPELTVQPPSKSCMLDPIPASLLKQRLDDLLPPRTAIVGASLSTGTVLSSSSKRSLYHT